MPLSSRFMSSWPRWLRVGKMTNRTGLILIMAILFLSPQVALGLAPGSPDIYVQVDSTTKVTDIPVGGSLQIKINIISQQGYEGNTQITLVTPPAGVTATFTPNPVEVLAFDQGVVTVKIDVASSVAEGKITLKINAKGV